MVVRSKASYPTKRRAIRSLDAAGYPSWLFAEACHTGTYWRWRLSWSRPMAFVSEADRWSQVAYHCAYDETLLGVLIDSLIGHGTTQAEAETVLSMAWEIADDRDEDSLRTDAIDAVTSRLAAVSS